MSTATTPSTDSGPAAPAVKRSGSLRGSLQQLLAFGGLIVIVVFFSIALFFSLRGVSGALEEIDAHRARVRR